MKKFFNYVLDKPQFVLATASDTSHYKSLKNFLKSAIKFESKSIIVVYDLGLSCDELTLLKSLYPSVIYKTFEFDNFPDYFNIRKNAGEYAWKPIIIDLVMKEFKCDVFWMDSGNILVSKLSKIKRFLYMYGFFSNFSQGTINDWTFSKTLAYMGVSKQILNRRNLNGACIGFSYSNQTSMELLKKWVECALIKECIAPKGSNRSNHRQDQAVLSVLAYQLNIVDELQKYIDLEKYYGFKIHQDVN